MRIRTVIKRTLLLLVGLPATALLVLALGMPLYFRLTAVPVHADPSSVPVHAGPPVAARWTFAADESARLARTLVAKDNLPGLSIAIAVDGELAWTGAFGWADIEAQVPATPDTRYRIGTASAPLTAAAAGLLVRRGLLDLDLPVQRYLPDFPVKSAPVTTRQALAQTAGFGDRHIEGACPSGGPGSVLQGLQLFADHPLRFTPGSDFRYSRYGWILVSAVVESIATRPFADFMAREVFEPLGMRATWPDLPDADMPERARLYHPRASADSATGLEEPDFTDFSCFAGAGAYLSTPTDLVRFALALDDASLLGEETTRMLETPVVLANGLSTGYALGWFVAEVPFGAGRTRVLEHPGVTIGGTTALRRYPAQGIVVAISTNLTFAELDPLASQVAALFVAARGVRQDPAAEPATAPAG